MKSIPLLIPYFMLAAATTLFVLRADTNLDSESPDLENPTPLITGPMVTHAIAEPLSDTAVNEDGDSVPVYAGFEADAEGVYLGIPSVGFQAVITNHPLAEKLEWKVTPLENTKSPNGQGCMAPRIMDQLAPGGYLQPNGDGWVESSFSLAYGAILIDYRYQRPGETREEFKWSARDGDSFEVRCRVKGPAGYYEQPVRWYFHIVPGPKEIHIAVSDPGRDEFVQENACQFEAWEQDDFETTFSYDRVLTPVGSGEAARFIVYCFDRYRNPLPAGVPVEWQLKGGGSLGTIKETQTGFDVEPGMTDEIANCMTTRAGRAEVGFKQTIYPTCPWSPQFVNELASSINFIVHDDLSTANRSKLAPDEVQPGPIPKGVRLKWLPITDWVNPKIDKRETRGFQVTAVYVVGHPGTDAYDVENPLAGAEVVWHSSNGSLFPASSTITDDQGRTEVTLTSAGALKGELLVAAALNNEREVLSPAGACWETSPDALYLGRERPMIAGDRAVDGTVEIETLDDRGDLLGPEGDGLIEIPVFASSRITIHGAPDHEYTVNALPVDGVTAHYSRVVYSFEDLLDSPPGGTPGADRKYSPSECGQHHAEVFVGGNTVAPAAEGRRAVIDGSNLAGSDGNPLDGLFSLEQSDDMNGKIAFAWSPDGAPPVHSLSWTQQNAWRMVLDGGSAVFESTAAVASPNEIPAGAWHETLNPHAWRALTGAGVPAVAVSSGSFREIIPHAGHRLDAGGEVVFADPQALLAVGSPGSGFSFCFAINTPRPNTNESIPLMTNKGGASLYLDRTAATGKCRVRLVFDTSIAGVTASRTLLGDEFDDDPRRWFGARIHTWANRLVLQVSQSDSFGPNGRVPAEEHASRDEFGHLAGYEAGKVYHLAANEVFPPVTPAPARIQPGQVVSYDLIEFTHDQTPAGSAVAEFVGLSPRNTIKTGPDGTASFFIKSTGGMDPRDSFGVVVSFEVTGSPTVKGHVLVNGSVSQGHLLEMFKPFVQGMDDLPPGSPFDHQKAAAILSEIIPFWGAGRDIFKWAYKMGSGCDEVSGWGILWHGACFIGDAVGAGALGKQVKIGSKGKAILQAMKSLASSAAILVALDVTVNVAMKQVAAYLQDYAAMVAFVTERGDANSSQWTLHAAAMMLFVQKRLQNGEDSPLNNNFFGAIGGANDCMSLSEMLNDFGEEDFESFMSIDPDNPPAE